MIHLCGRALKQAAATAAEQGVAAKQPSRAVVGDMTGGMAGHVQDVERQSERFDMDGLWFGAGMRHAWDCFAGRSMNRNIKCRGQRGYAPDVIVVMVGDQDAAHLELMLGDERQHRFGVAGIDHGDMTLIVQRPDIIILKSANRGKVYFCIHARYDTMTDHYNSFAEWFAGSAGDYLRLREQAMFDWMTADLFGFNAVQIGLSQVDMLHGSRIKHRYHLDIALTADVCAEPARLPFASQSVDLLVLPHALEFFLYPHQILREAERVLIPEGNLLISGFNPYSLWGAYHWYKQHRGEFDWHGHFVSLYRLHDWLSLLGCEQQITRMCCFVPPLAHSRWVPWFEMLEVAGSPWWTMWGGVYFVHAIKRVHGMRLLMPTWQENRRLGRALRPASTALQAEQDDGSR